MEVSMFSLMQFLGAFANLLQATVSFVMPVRRVHTEQLVSHRTDFRETLYLSIFRESVEEIQV
jgi:hypothetical protein